MKLLFNLTHGLDRVGRIAAIALGFSIPISAAVDNLLLAVLLGCFIAGANYREKLSFIARNPALLVPTVLFGLLVLGALHGAAEPGEARKALFKYADLLLIPVMATFFSEPSTRRMSLYAFVSSIIVTVLLSFALYVGLSRSPLLVYDQTYAVPFKHSLTHSILVGFGTFVFVQFAVAARSRATRWTWLSLAALAMANITFLVPGRTGYLILGALALYTGFALWRWAGLIRMIALSLLVIAIAYHASDRFRDRVTRGLAEYSAQRAGAPVDAASAVGLRIEFYRNSAAIVRDHPLFGAGTGGFRSAYADRVKGSGMTATANPHNEYLLIAVQLGIAGLLAMLYMFWVQWSNAPRLESTLQCHLARGLVLTIAIGCLFNSLLFDHTEGLLFAWLTALLYAGSQSKQDTRPSALDGSPR